MQQDLSLHKFYLPFTKKNKIKCPTINPIVKHLWGRLSPLTGSYIASSRIVPYRMKENKASEL